MADVPSTGPRSSSRVLPGSSFPVVGPVMGADGASFSVISDVADQVVLCLFDERGAEEQLPLPECSAGVWHGFVPGIRAGQAYGFRTTGPAHRSLGIHCNPAQLLLDPYARAIHGSVTFGPELSAYTADQPQVPNPADSAGNVPRSVLVDGEFDWAADVSPSREYADSVLIELHVKGFTQTHPDIPPQLRGTYGGLAHPAAIEHLVKLGITAVELLPVHQSIPEAFLVERGLTNYWGYNSIGFFAPHEAYSAAARGGQPGGQVAEFKSMVKALHAAGLEVILDVVFNHTAEGGLGGPALCFRGLDNPGYYRLSPSDPSEYFDTTGCGNSLNVGSSTGLRLIMDSLRYWVTDMHVDGFRFDLAATLARQEGGFDPRSAFFDLIAQDPVISRVKLFAEPWDVGQSDSYDSGGFPPNWSEWNGKYRDTMRNFWRSNDGLLGEFATRFTGSADLFGGSRRRPTASLNMITVHDGFTLRDLVSYSTKHNEANGESNRDGSDDNRSWNCGVEGVTTDPDVLALRQRQSRAMLATLLLSFGVPLLLGGDEIGRTQSGNNNAYCQDSPLSWFDWAQVDDDLLAFAQQVVALRRTHPVFRRRRFLIGADAANLRWYTPTGCLMTPQDWTDPLARAVALVLDGRDDPDLAEDGQPLLDDNFMLLVCSWWEPLSFTMPDVGGSARWTLELDSYAIGGSSGPGPVLADFGAGDLIHAGPRSIVLLRSTPS
jgi:isoamylase